MVRVDHRLHNLITFSTRVLGAVNTTLNDILQARLRFAGPSSLSRVQYDTSTATNSNSFLTPFT